MKEGYGVSQAKNQITATFYDNPEQAPAPNVIPEVSISITNNELYESQASETTLKFTKKGNRQSAVGSG